MSEPHIDEQQSATQSPKQPNGAEPAPETPIGWLIFDQQLVVIQLKEDYIGVTYPAEVVVNKENAPFRTPLLRGVLRVLPNGEGGILLVLMTADPINPAGRVHLTIHPADVLHCTAPQKPAEQARIVAP
jgi:hypothetical protein